MRLGAASKRKQPLCRRSDPQKMFCGFSLSKKSACGGLFRQKLKKCLRPGAQTPRPPGTGGKRQPCGLLPPKAAKRPEGGERNERWARSAPSAKIERPGKAGRYEFTLEGTEGSVSPVGCCHRRWQSDPKESTETSGGRGQRPSRRLRLRTCGSSKPPQMGYLAAWGRPEGRPFFQPLPPALSPA